MEGGSNEEGRSFDEAAKHPVIVFVLMAEVRLIFPYRSAVRRRAAYQSSHRVVSGCSSLMAFTTLSRQNALIVEPTSRT
jgi:hypothetical protein